MPKCSSPSFLFSTSVMETANWRLVTQSPGARSAVSLKQESFWTRLVLLNVKVICCPKRLLLSCQSRSLGWGEILEAMEEDFQLLIEFWKTIQCPRRRRRVIAQCVFADLEKCRQCLGRQLESVSMRNSRHILYLRKSNSICVNTFPLQRLPGQLENPLMSRQRERMKSVRVTFKCSD